MEKTDVDEFVKANFPDLAEHAKWIDGLTRIQKEIASEKGIYARKIKPLQEERRDLLKDARKEGVDTKALKQLKLVLDFMDKNVVNVHDKIGDDAGDTVKAMFDQFSLPFSEFRPGKDLVAEAKAKYKASEQERKDKLKAAKAANKKSKPATTKKAPQPVSLETAAAKTATGQKNAKETAEA